MLLTLFQEGKDDVGSLADSSTNPVIRAIPKIREVESNPTAPTHPRISRVLFTLLRYYIFRRSRTFW